MANTYELIASNTVGSGGTASVTFSSISGSYTDILLKVSARSDTANIANGMFIQINSITSGYSAKNLYGDGAAASSNSNPYSITAKLWAGSTNANSSTSNTFGNAEIYIPNYSGSNYKSASVDGVIENNATTGYQNLAASLLSNTAVISSLTLTLDSGNFMQYSSFYLYGIKNS